MRDRTKEWREKIRGRHSEKLEPIVRDGLWGENCINPVAFCEHKQLFLSAGDMLGKGCRTKPDFSQPEALGCRFLGMLPFGISEGKAKGMRRAVHLINRLHISMDSYQASLSGLSRIALVNQALEIAATYMAYITLLQGAHRLPKAGLKYLLGLRDPLETVSGEMQKRFQSSARLSELLRTLMDATEST